MREETVLRKTLHHPLIYFIAALIALVAGWISTGNVGQGLGQAIGTWIVVWFVTGLIP